MCSIAGVYWLDYNSPNTNILKEMTERALTALRNRGPDESSMAIVHNKCVMGGNRLIIRGDFRNGSMPFTYNENILFYDGEIYNYKKWNKQALSDGEVILPLFREFGYKIFSEFDGEFAISIWDSSKNSLILARDPFGTKPVYFSLNKKRLLWASSAHAINQMEKHEFCAAVKGPTYQHSYAVQEPYTSYNGIWLLPPGHFLIANSRGIKLYCYNQWQEYYPQSENLDEVFTALDETLKLRLDYNGIIGIPMSGGIDSGIIAFMADQLNLKYHLFSVVKIFGKSTEETNVILKRIKRLRNVNKVTLLECNEEQYQKALKEMFLPNYYDSEKFDNGNIVLHTVFDAMKREGIKVAIDGGGGDELFHGYTIRDDFKPVKDWPRPWKTNNYFYSLFTTLLDYTSKTDRAGSYFSIESRFPFQSIRLMRAALEIKYSSILKWPLRKYLLEHLNYGSPLRTDLYGKFGFSIENRDKTSMITDMQMAWCKSNDLSSLPVKPATKFPFKMGVKKY